MIENIFSGLQLLKYHKTDPLRDAEICLKVLKGEKFIHIAKYYGFSPSTIKTRYLRVTRRVCSCLKESGYDLKRAKEYKKWITPFCVLYKEYIENGIKNNTLYRPFKKDLPKQLKNNARKMELCKSCNRYYKINK